MVTNKKRPAIQSAIDFFYEPSQWCIVHETGKLELVSLNDLWSIHNYKHDENGMLIRNMPPYTRTEFNKEHFTTPPELLKMLYGDMS